jgi:hydroxymethylglutaryl-CoA reductase
MNNEQQIKDIDRQILKVSIMDAPGSILFGLGLYGKFAVNGDAFIPMLNEASIVNSCLAAGAAIMAWGGYKILTLSREKSQLKNA